MRTSESCRAATRRISGPGAHPSMVGADHLALIVGTLLVVGGMIAITFGIET